MAEATSTASAAVAAEGAVPGTTLFWKTFLAQVDSSAQEADVLQEAAEVFHAANLRDANSVIGCTEEEVVALGPETLSLPARSLVRRCVRAIGQAAKVEEAKSLAAVSVPATGFPPVPPASSNGGTAAVLPTTLAIKSPPVDVYALLEKVGMQGVPSDAIPELLLFTQLEEHAKAAKEESRVPFMFIDLTSKDLLPLWMTPEMVGGTTTLEGEENELLDAGAATGTIQQLHQAFKKATSRPRFFRSISQWLPCFHKYGIAATATGHLTMAAIMGHVHSVCRVELDKRSNAKHSTVHALLYDELRRRDWARRAERKDPTLNIDKEAWVIDDEILKAVGTRMQTTMVAAGLSHNADASGSGNAGDALAALAGSRESALTKQAAAIEANVRKAEAAARQADAQSKRGGQQNHQFRQGGYQAPKGLGGKNGGGKGGGIGFQNNGGKGGKRHNQGGGNNFGRRVIPRTNGGR